MSLMIAMSQCAGCHRPFTYNPYLVPSLTINGVKEPFCQDCINRANITRYKHGLDLIVPLPGAYEPVEDV